MTHLKTNVPQKLSYVLIQTQPGFLEPFSPNLIVACCVHSPIGPEVHYEKKANTKSIEISVT